MNKYKNKREITCCMIFMHYNHLLCPLNLSLNISDVIIAGLANHQLPIPLPQCAGAECEALNTYLVTVECVKRCSEAGWWVGE